MSDNPWGGPADNPFAGGAAPRAQPQPKGGFFGVATAAPVVGGGSSPFGAFKASESSGFFAAAAAKPADENPFAGVTAKEFREVIDRDADESDQDAADDDFYPKGGDQVQEDDDADFHQALSEDEPDSPQAVPPARPATRGGRGNVNSALNRSSNARASRGRGGSSSQPPVLPASPAAASNNTPSAAAAAGPQTPPVLPPAASAAGAKLQTPQPAPSPAGGAEKHASPSSTKQQPTNDNPFFGASSGSNPFASTNVQAGNTEKHSSPSLTKPQPTNDNPFGASSGSNPFASTNVQAGNTEKHASPSLSKPQPTNDNPFGASSSSNPFASVSSSTPAARTKGFFSDQTTEQQKKALASVFGTSTAPPSHADPSPFSKAATVPGMPETGGGFFAAAAQPRQVSNPFANATIPPATGRKRSERHEDSEGEEESEEEYEEDEEYLENIEDDLAHLEEGEESEEDEEAPSTPSLEQSPDRGSAVSPPSASQSPLDKKQKTTPAPWSPPQQQEEAAQRPTPGVSSPTPAARSFPSGPLAPAAPMPPPAVLSPPKAGQTPSRDSPAAPFQPHASPPPAAASPAAPVPAPQQQPPAPSPIAENAAPRMSEEGALAQLVKLLSSAEIRPLVQLLSGDNGNEAGNEDEEEDESDDETSSATSSSSSSESEDENESAQWTAIIERSLLEEQQRSELLEKRMAVNKRLHETQADADREEAELEETIAKPSNPLPWRRQRELPSVPLRSATTASTGESLTEEAQRKIGALHAQHDAVAKSVAALHKVLGDNEHAAKALLGEQSRMLAQAKPHSRATETGAVLEHCEKICEKIRLESEALSADVSARLLALAACAEVTDEDEALLAKHLPELLEVKHSIDARLAAVHKQLKIVDAKSRAHADTLRTAEHVHKEAVALEGRVLGLWKKQQTLATRHQVAIAMKIPCGDRPDIFKDGLAGHTLSRPPVLPPTLTKRTMGPAATTANVSVGRGGNALAKRLGKISISATGTASAPGMSTNAAPALIAAPPTDQRRRLLAPSLVECLKEVRLEHIGEILQESGIVDETMLMQLRRQDLQNLGLTIGEEARLLAAVNERVHDAVRAARERIASRRSASPSDVDGSRRETSLPAATQTPSPSAERPPRASTLSITRDTSPPPSMTETRRPVPGQGPLFRKPAARSAAADATPPPASKPSAPRQAPSDSAASGRGGKKTQPPPPASATPPVVLSKPMQWRAPGRCSFEFAKEEISSETLSAGAAPSKAKEELHAYCKQKLGLNTAQVDDLISSKATLDSFAPDPSAVGEALDRLKAVRVENSPARSATVTAGAPKAAETPAKTPPAAAPAAAFGAAAPAGAAGFGGFGAASSSAGAAVSGFNAAAPSSGGGAAGASFGSAAPSSSSAGFGGFGATSSSPAAAQSGAAAAVKVIRVTRQPTDKGTGVAIDASCTVSKLGAGGAAERAGLKVGMKVLKIAGAPVASQADAKAALQAVLQGPPDFDFEVADPAAGLSAPPAGAAAAPAPAFGAFGAAAPPSSSAATPAGFAGFGAASSSSSGGAGFGGFGAPAAAAATAASSSAGFGGFGGGGSGSAPAFGGFGAPAAAPASAPAFGAPVAAGASSSAPAFGASSSTPAFGAPAAGSAPAFGAPAAGVSGSAPAFGASSSTPAFGAPAAGSAPAFGAPAAGASGAAPAFGGFGAPAAPAPAFGAAPAAAGFGAPAAAGNPFGSGAAAASGGPAFSAAAPSAASFGAFGAAPAAPAFGAARAGPENITITKQRPDEKLGLKEENLVITECRPGFVGQRAGLAVGMKILSVNGQPITSSAQFKEAVKQLQSHPSFVFAVERGSDPSQAAGFQTPNRQFGRPEAGLTPGAPGGGAWGQGPSPGPFSR
ncbi:Nuclear pore complex protein NUP98A [Diplonema papillatum]|nr:Nuclear pore complex protein NUP98A [Diplonema papillatum]